MNLGVVIHWLKRKIRKGNPNNSTFSSRAAISLKESENWELRLPKYLSTAIQLITQRISSNKGSTIIGQCKLTEVSLTIGKHVISQYPGRTESSNTYEQLSVGDYLIGSLHYGGYIKIYRDEAYSEWDTAAPYVIEILPSFLNLLNDPEMIKAEEESDDIHISATESEKIPDVSEMIQGHNRSIIKEYNSEHIRDLEEAVANDDPWIQSLNKMQQTGWKINQQVYDIVSRDIDKLILPVGKRPNKGCPKKLKNAFERLKKKDTPGNRKRYNKEAILWNKELDVLRPMSLNAATKTIMKKAKELLPLEQYYQYVELDYRGRAYYQEPFMNYQGPDLARGLIQFTEGKPLGETGKKWLEIHTATCYNASYNIQGIPSWCTYDYAALLREQGLEDISVDKMTLEDRAMWTRVNMAKVRSHANALQDCEKPVLYLACCLEWEQYAHDPNYISYLPVPIDGSCNGYQHSGAIAKDEVTGELVSLVDQKIQADLYLVVAQELLNKNPAFFAARPTMKMKHIRKGIVKRAVMTRAYSAGVDTMAENMYSDCHTEGYTTQFNINMFDCLSLAEDVYELCSTVCPGATKTMKFLQDLAKFQLGDWKSFDPDGTEVSINERNKRHELYQAAKKTKDPAKIEAAEIEAFKAESRCIRGNGTDHLVWVSPTGFVIRYYAYHQKRWKYKMTVPNYGRVNHVVLVDKDKPHAGDFQAGISPNFIHSMDAAHMAGVIWAWDKPFGAIHDSYSALACDVEELSQLTRQVFVDIYDHEDPYRAISENILRGEAAIDFDLPETGQLEVSDVLKSRYFFS